MTRLQPASSTALDRLRAAGLRPTRQRLGARAAAARRTATATSPPSSCTARLRRARIPVSLATVYNTLHQFTEAGLLREVVVEPGRSYFDTNTADHHHFFCEANGMLQDIPALGIAVSGLPAAPAGTAIRRVDVIVRVGPQGRRSSPR